MGKKIVLTLILYEILKKKIKKHKNMINIFKIKLK
jgi:hypothetical protein